MSYSIDFDVATSEQIAAALCRRIEAIRLSRNITQAELAKKAQMSTRTLRRLENGEKVTLDSLIRVLMALDLHENLKALLPDPSLRPIERAALGGKERRRASGGGEEATTSEWVWGDEER